MKKKELENIKTLVNKTGPGFCPAKWYNSTIWLSNGRTASCHHPEAHYIPPREVFKDPSALHNTEFKKQRRKEMLEGKRPTECTYCWAVEDADPDALSDRVFKSSIYTKEEIAEITQMGWDENVNPKTLEISFDNIPDVFRTYVILVAAKHLHVYLNGDETTQRELEIKVNLQQVKVEREHLKQSKFNLIKGTRLIDRGTNPTALI